MQDVRGTELFDTWTAMQSFLQDMRCALRVAEVAEGLAIFSVSITFWLNLARSKRKIVTIVICKAAVTACHSPWKSCLSVG